MKAIPGGTAHHDQIDAQKLAVLLRGGRRPQADVYPAAMRPTRDLLRPRLSRVRQRAALRPHVQQTTSQETRPALGKNSAYQATREGVAARLPAAAVQKRIEGDLPRIAHDARLLRARELASVQTATRHAPQTLYRRPSVPGIGQMLRLVLV